MLSLVTSPNPLLAVSTPIPFDQVRPEHVQPAITHLISQARARIDEIAATPAPLTYWNTLAALDCATEPLDLAVAVVRHLEAVVTTPELRAAWNAVQPEISAFYSTIPLHEGLWTALKSYAATGDASSLQGVRARFLRKTLDAFRRHGADLNPEGKKQLEAIEVELSVLTTKFAQNVLDATAAFEYFIDDEAKLAGLPPSAISAARHGAESKGRSGWRFTLQAPSYLAVVTYLDDASVRELFYRAYNSRAAEPNAALITQILDLRRRKAALLGFAHFADFNLVDRMAKTGAAARAFLDDLCARTGPAFQRENAELAAFAGVPALNPWDIAYWAEKQRAAQYAFEEEDLRPYFPVHQVVAGMFDLVRRLYGISVVEGPAVPVWHPEVKFYEIRDEDGVLLSAFYADWFPRETKRGGAWMDAFVTGAPLNVGSPEGAWRPHVGLMCGNLTPPVGDTPALLTHREVETIFHEFGHLLHHSLSRVEVKSLCGTNVAWDFVELPSQIMENWCWERESLDLFAHHWQTAEPIPGDLFRKLTAARTFRAANAQMRQVGFATVDLALHIDYDPASHGEVIAYANSLLSPFTPAPLPGGYAMLASFTHLFADATGYGAGYYSYKWAEVLEADAFTRFRREGIFNRETGRAFRESILSKGDSEDPAELFRRFLGRDPDPNALLQRLGLL
ncbi:MAG: M3 family metallopeptidase [Acidobacteria bacterium]|nr:M3 family metallopeptidase [Acidobacteriota bacterium]